MPLLPGTGLLDDVEQALAEAERIGYPVMLKSTAGGGGIGMQLCAMRASLRERFETRAAHGAGELRRCAAFISSASSRDARHVEVQIFGDGKGSVVALGERDCSLQRRNQKVSRRRPRRVCRDDMRAAPARGGGRAGRSVNYDPPARSSSSTTSTREEFYFLEVNTRLQVEHPVTEAVFGIDLVEWMIRQAAGEDPCWPMRTHWRRRARAIEVRALCGRSRTRIFARARACSPRSLSRRRARRQLDRDRHRGHAVLRSDAGQADCHGDNRDEAIGEAARSAGADTDRRHRDQSRLSARHCRARSFSQRGDVATTALQRFRLHAAHRRGARARRAIDRAGFAGPPRLLGRRRAAERADGRAVASASPIASSAMPKRRRRWNSRSRARRCVSMPTPLIALGGARMQATLDGVAGPDMTRRSTCERARSWRSARIEGPGHAHAISRCAAASTRRSIWARARPSRSADSAATPTGALKAGDVLHLGEQRRRRRRASSRRRRPPALTHDWEIGVLYGPHGAPDFFTRRRHRNAVLRRI